MKFHLSVNLAQAYWRKRLGKSPRTPHIFYIYDYPVKGIKMGSRLLIQLIILLAPFAIYGLYRIAIEEAAAEGKKPWPIFRLFVIGFALTAATWVLFKVFEVKECREPSQLIDGKIVEGAVIPCERDMTNIGIPATEDPGAREAPDEPSGEDDE